MEHVLISITVVAGEDKLILRIMLSDVVFIACKKVLVDFYCYVSFIVYTFKGAFLRFVLSFDEYTVDINFGRYCTGC